jgi:hypothetical protein
MNLIQSIAVLLSMFGLWFLFARQGVCPLCCGRGKHRHDCPNAREDDTRDGD